MSALSAPEVEEVKEIEMHVVTNINGTGTSAASNSSNDSLVTAVSVSVSVSVSGGSSTAETCIAPEITTVSPERGTVLRETVQETTEGIHLFSAFAMLTSNQMSQMLLLLPSCVAILGWWRATVVLVAFGILSCRTAQLLQGFWYRLFETAQTKDEIVQWDIFLSDNYGGAVRKLGMLGVGFNILCLLTRSIIQLTYAVSIIYFFEDKLDKRNWTYVLAFCCVLICVAFLPGLTKNKYFCVFSFATATVAALSIAIASLLQLRTSSSPSQGVEHTHTVVSSSVKSWAWVSGTIIFAFGDGPVSAETFFFTHEEECGTLLDFQQQINDEQFKYALWGSVICASIFSFAEALSSYWVFGDKLAKVPPAALPCTLAVLPPSHWRDINSILLLILQLIAISHSLYPLIIYLRRALALLHRKEEDWKKLHKMARACVVGFICFMAAAIPFSGSMEITSLVGSFVVSPAIYMIPALVHMLYFRSKLRQQAVRLLSCTINSMNDGLTVVAWITSYIMDIIQFAGVLIFVVIMGGILTSIGKVFYSHNFHHSDFWNRCYLCADLWLPSAFAPVSAPAPSHNIVHCLAINRSMFNGTC